MPEWPELSRSRCTDLTCPATDASRQQQRISTQYRLDEHPPPDLIVNASGGRDWAQGLVSSPPFPDHSASGTVHSPNVEFLQPGSILPEACSGHHQEMQWKLITKKLQNKGPDLGSFGAAQNRAFVPRPPPLAQELPDASETSSIRKLNIPKRYYIEPPARSIWPYRLQPVMHRRDASSIMLAVQCFFHGHPFTEEALVAAEKPPTLPHLTEVVPSVFADKLSNMPKPKYLANVNLQLSTNGVKPFLMGVRVNDPDQYHFWYKNAVEICFTQDEGRKLAVLVNFRMERGNSVNSWREKDEMEDAIERPPSVWRQRRKRKNEGNKDMVTGEMPLAKKSGTAWIKEQGQVESDAS